MPIVDVAFRLQGTRIPADHAYRLFAAVTDIVPSLHAGSHSPFLRRTLRIRDREIVGFDSTLC